MSMSSLESHSSLFVIDNLPMRRSERMKHSEQLMVQVQLALRTIVMCDGVHCGPHHRVCKE